ncbi:MAG: methyltransferase domain-containing protein [Candidatus Nanohaloarchaea archaeon]
MTYIYRLAGDDMELAEAELNGFLSAIGADEKADRRRRIAFTETHPDQLRRLALVHEISEKLENGMETDYRPDGSFAVRAEDLTGEKDAKELERELGEKLLTDSNSVNLENPGEVINAYILEDEIIVAKRVLKIDRGLFRLRRNQERSFQSPVSLDPVLARVLVNLSEVSPGEKLLDPFCGTGGVLIEAGLCGIDVYGTDIQHDMVEGTKENLENYGIINHHVEKADIEEVTDLFDFRFDAVVTDLPYGKASKKTGEPVKKFLDSLDSLCKGKAVFMSNEESLEGLEPEFEVYVHRNLTRYIYTI